MQIIHHTGVPLKQQNRLLKIIHPTPQKNMSFLFPLNLLCCLVWTSSCETNDILIGYTWLYRFFFPKNPNSSLEPTTWSFIISNMRPGTNVFGADTLSDGRGIWWQGYDMLLVSGECKVMWCDWYDLKSTTMSLKLKSYLHGEWWWNSGCRWLQSICSSVTSASSFPFLKSSLIDHSMSKSKITSCMYRMYGCYR